MASHLDYWTKKIAHIPIIPPNAPISPSSTVKFPGKTPGVKTSDGWVGMPGWSNRPIVPDREEAEAWDRMGAGVGIRTGHANSIALDFDTPDEEDSLRTLTMAQRYFGRRLVLRRVDHPDHHKVLIFMRVEDGNAPSNIDLPFEGGALQVLGTGRQFVAEGLHPGRLKPYIWEHSPLELTLLVKRKKLDAFLEEFRTAMKAQFRSRDQSSRAQGSQEKAGDVDEVERLVKGIPNGPRFDDYLDFIGMGAAIWGATAGSKRGESIWREWCNQRPQRSGEAERVWASFASTGTTNGMHTLRHMYHREDPQRSAREEFANADPQAEDEPAVKDIQEQVEEFLTSYSLIHHDLLFYPHRKDGVPAFDSPISYAKFQGVSARFTDALKTQFKGKRNYEIFSANSPNVYDREVHLPGVNSLVVTGSNGQRDLNSWEPWRSLDYLGDVPDDDPAITDYVGHLNYLFDRNQSAVKPMLNWLSYVLQYPAEAPGWHPILMMKQGVGKDMLMKLIITYLTAREVAIVRFASLTSKWNPYAVKRLLIVSELPRDKGRNDLYTALKAGISTGNDSLVEMERKGHDPIQVRDRLCRIMFSNDTHPMRMAEDDRRFLLVRDMITEKRDPFYYTTMQETFVKDSDRICRWLMQRELSDVDLAELRGPAPRFEGSTELLRELSLEPWEQALEDHRRDMAHDPAYEGRPLATATELFTMLKNELHVFARHVPIPENFGPRLRALGYAPVYDDGKGGAGAYEGVRLWRIVDVWRGVDLSKVPRYKLVKWYKAGCEERNTPADDDSEV